jgi:hypothetical protein
VPASADIWDRWLSHPSSLILVLLASNKKVVYTSRPLNFQCQACLLGKTSCLSLGPTGYKTSTFLELIFSDVWSPAPMLSSDGFRYFVIFVDAHTKFIWFYPIALKSDVFNVFNFKYLLNVCSLEKSNLFKLIGVINIANYILFLKPSVFTIVLYVHIHMNKTVLLSVVIIILLKLVLLYLVSVRNL